MALWEPLPVLSIWGDQIAQCLGWSKQCHQLSSHGPRGLQSFCDFNSKIPAFFPPTFRILHREKKYNFFGWLRISEEVFSLLCSCIKKFIYWRWSVCSADSSQSTTGIRWCHPYTRAHWISCPQNRHQESACLKVFLDLHQCISVSQYIKTYNVYWLSDWTEHCWPSFVF